MNLGGIGFIIVTNDENYSNRVRIGERFLTMAGFVSDDLFTTVLWNLDGPVGGGNRTVHVSPCISSKKYGPSQLSFSGL